MVNNRFPTQEEWEKRRDMKARFDRIPEKPRKTVVVNNLPEQDRKEWIRNLHPWEFITVIDALNDGKTVEAEI